MQTTDNYSLKVYEGTDLFNPLTVENPNTVSIDTILKGISDLAVGTATELTTGTVHALTRSASDQALFRFTATSNFNVGDTFTVDTVQVSALTLDGKALPDEAYLAGAEVLCALVGTRLTVYGVSGSVLADDALKLGGELPSYYGKASDVTLAQNTATAAGTLATQLDGRVTAIESGYKKKLLWENLNPTASFDGQDIALSETVTNFDFILIFYKTSAGGTYVQSALVPSGMSAMLSRSSASAQGSICGSRVIDFSGTTAHISAGTQSTGSGSIVTNNLGVIPISIYGVKFG